MRASNQKNNINFTSTPLYHVNLKKVSNGELIGLESAIIAKLNPENEIDKEAIKQIQESLYKNEKFEGEHTIGKNFCGDFFGFFSNICQFNSIELPNNDILSKKTIGLMSFYKNFAENMHLSFLFTNPEFQSTNNNRNMKGVGEIGLGRVFKVAKKLNAPEVGFTYSEDSKGFYSKTFRVSDIDLSQKGNSINEFRKIITVGQNDFDKYLNYIKDEYKTDFSRVIRNGIEV